MLHSNTKVMRLSETLKLTRDAFILRWAEHVHLSGKQTVRYGGLYSSASRDRLNKARKHFKQSPVSERIQLAWLDYMEGLGDLPRCRECGKPLTQRVAVEKMRAA